MEGLQGNMQEMKMFDDIGRKLETNLWRNKNPSK